MDKYRLIFEDNLGRETIDCFTDGSILNTTIRGYQFKASSFNLFHIDCENIDGNQYRFDMKDDCICGIFTLEIPIIIQLSDAEHKADLILKFDYRDNQVIQIAIELLGVHYSSIDAFEFVEDAICHLQTLLPYNTHLHCCLSCKYAHYHPIGNNDFGSLLCIKRVGENQIKQIIDKESLLELFDAECNSTKIQSVLETYCCSKFQIPDKTDWLYKNSLL